mgnify:CR=1 FL=1
MIIIRLMVILLLVSMLPAAKASAAPPDKGVGLHLTKINAFRTGMPFADIFKYALIWITQRAGVSGNTKEKLPLDADGWIKSLEPGQRAKALMLWVKKEIQPTGIFEMTYTGNGRMTFGDNVKIVNKSKGRMTLEISQGVGAILAIEETDPKDPIRNIKIWLPGTPENGDKKNEFNPAYMKLTKDFRVFRYMDWLRANKDRVVSWEDRVKPTNATQASDKGVALEHIVGFSNRMKAAPWINIHHRASDRYVRKFAEFFRDNLNPDLKIYIEYSNEVWNSRFPQKKYAAKMAKKRGYKSSDEFYFRRSIEIFKIFEDVFGDDKRLVRVIASQFWNLNRIKQLLKYKKSGDKFDALADPVMTEQRRTQLRDAVFALDDLANVEELMRLTVADR